MRILITFAVDDEFAPWRKLRPFVRVKHVAAEAYRCSVNGLDVLVVLTGVGGRKSWLDVAKSVWNFDIDICLASGLAGGLRPELSVGDIVVPNHVEARVSHPTIACDSEMINLAVQCGAKQIEILCSVDRVIINSDEKKKLGDLADVVDMETADVLSEAAARGARTVAIRAISDSVNEDLPVDFNRVVTQNGDVSIPRVLGQIARHPSALPALVKFGRQSRAAAEKLAAFMDRYLESLAETVVATASKARAQA